MATALEKTIEFLGNSSTAQAIDVLLAALELDDRRYQAATTRALLNHSSARGQMALIRRLPELTVEARELIRDHSSQLFRSFNHCLEHADSATRTHVLEFICSHELFAHIPALVASLQSHTHQPQIATQDTLRFLTQRLYDCSRSTAEPLLSTHTAADLRSWTRAAFDALAAACDNLEALPDPRFVVETALALGDIQHPTFEHLFDTPTVRRQAANCLMTSCHPGVMQRILDILGTPYPHAAALKALNQRDDLPFICFLLRWFRDQPERTARNNLKLINTLPWIPVEAERLPQIPASLQPVLPTFVARTGVPHEQQDRLSTWLVRHGRAAARTAADGILQRVDSSTAEDIVMSALADPDPSVQAWATSRLRSLKTHHALHRLLKQLDNRHAEVARAARDAMHDFNLATMLTLIDALDPATCARAGNLLLKTHPQCLDELRDELVHPHPRRRLRGLRATLALKLHEHLRPQLAAMAHDAWPPIRRAAAQFLKCSPTSESPLPLEGTPTGSDQFPAPQADAADFKRRDDPHAALNSSRPSSTRQATGSDQP